MKVRELLNPYVVTVDPNASIVDAARAMREQHVGSVVVVERRFSGRVPVGILTDRDIVVGIVAQEVQDLASIRVGDAMNREVVVCGADEDVLDAIRRMRRFAVRRMPVVNDLEVLVGIVSYDDLVLSLSESLASLARLFPSQRENEAIHRT